MTGDIERWLEALDLIKYRDAFAANEIAFGDLSELTEVDIVDEMLVIDDGSTDRSAEVARREGARVISMGHVAGVGAALRAGYSEALARGYDVAVVMAGNNKDSPEEIARLLDPIAEGRADFVQGSRFLQKGADFGAMPFYRKVATRVHPLLFSLVAGRWFESTHPDHFIRLKW